MIPAYVNVDVVRVLGKGGDLRGVSHGGNWEVNSFFRVAFACSGEHWNAQSGGEFPPRPLARMSRRATSRGTSSSRAGALRSSAATILRFLTE